MTIRELLRVVPENDTIEIKPDGRRTYFLGRGKGVPECLKAGEITEISVTVVEEKGFIIGVKIADIKEWDLLYDKLGVADDVSSLTFDIGYYQLINEEIEFPEEFYSLDDSSIAIEQVEKEVEEMEALLLAIKREME